MLINETSKMTKLTKKAIEYYIKQNLVSPNILKNGYRDFCENDIEQLKKISVLRKLGLTIEEIRIVLTDQTGNILQKLAIQKELNMQREQAKKAMLDQLSCNKNYDEITIQLKAIEQNVIICEKLLDAFPGYYGRFICLHFAQFLNEPITTSQQEAAYQEIIAFLDNIQIIDFPEYLQRYLMENTKQISIEDINKIIKNTKQSIENPEQFLLQNKEVLKQYLVFRKSDEYKHLPVCKIQSLLKEFNNTSGYYEIFIPAMKRLSVSYAKYYRQIEAANEKLLTQYPEIAEINN